MQVSLTAQDLIDFEQDIAMAFLDKQIPHPIHLSSGNEDKLIKIFHDHVQEEDWIFTSWRSHFHCLLKGVPPERLKADIFAGRSMALCYPEYRILSSAIVGGAACIATGVAAALRMKQGEGEMGRAVVFVGDMTAKCGIVHEAMQYTSGHNLPILWVVENNWLSVLTDTESVWPPPPKPSERPKPIQYNYDNKRFPHCGVGQWVQF